jgi:hypothetical protein
MSADRNLLFRRLTLQRELRGLSSRKPSGLFR